MMIEYYKGNAILDNDFDYKPPYEYFFIIGNAPQIASASLTDISAQSASTMISSGTEARSGETDADFQRRVSDEPRKI